MSRGSKIIEGLKDAVAGNFARVTIEGQVWVREALRPSPAAGWQDAIEQCTEALLRVQENAPDSTDLDERDKYYASGWINGCSAALKAIRAISPPNSSGTGT